MSDEKLPDTKAARVDWVIRAPSNSEMRERYNDWAAQYDADLGTREDYLAPIETAKVARAQLELDARIIDAGAGTGLAGQALRVAGFQHLTAVDYSAKMLAMARAKGIYDTLHECDLNHPTTFEPDSVDAVISCGTTSQMPSASLREFARIVRPGGKIIFAVIPAFWDQCGYADIFAELEAAGRLSMVSRGTAFQMMPTTEPDFMCEIWVMAVH